MRLRTLLIAFVSMTLAQQRNAQRSARTPQAQIKYHDPNGLKVDWKFFAPQNQWRSHLQNSQHHRQQESAQPEESSLSNHHGQPQSRLLQVESDPPQQKSYSENQVQPEAQPYPNHIQYKTYVQPQVAEANSKPNQLEYKAYPQHQVSLETQPEDPDQIHYNAYSDATSHAKQVVLENFKSHHPYNDPSAFIYAENGADSQQYERQVPNSELSRYEQPSEGYEQAEQQKTRRDYTDRGLQGRIVYKQEYERQLLQQQQEQHRLQQQHEHQHQLQLQQQQQQQEHEQQQEPQVEHVPVPIERLPQQPPQKLVFDKNMPSELQQLLHYQAQIPYAVIANSISYKPKTLFVPKPLPSETKGPYNYRSKIYYVNNDEYQADFETTKPVEEEQRH